MKRIPRILAAFDTSRGWGRELMRGVAGFAMERKWWNCHFTTEEATDNTIRRAALVNGLLIHVTSVEMAAAVSRLKVPTVVIGGEYGPTNVPCVTPDYAAVAELAVTHLIERGFRRFAYYAHFGSIEAVMRGQLFAGAAKKRGYSCGWFQLKAIQKPVWRPNYVPLLAWLKKLQKPVAVLTVGDGVAREIAEACRDVQIRVPEQLAILGLNNDALVCRMCHPHLSSIDTRMTMVGFEAARLLQRMLDGHVVPPRTVLVPPVGVVARESTDVMMADDPYVSAAVPYIREHLSEGVNVKQLARYLRVSWRTVDEAFRREYGQTAHDKIMRMQLERVCLLLEEGKLPLAQRTESGLHYKSRLGNFFKKHMGITPLEYRKSHQRTDFLE